jgi:hypothetical protein
MLLLRPGVKELDCRQDKATVVVSTLHLTLGLGFVCFLAATRTGTWQDHEMNTRAQNQRPVVFSNSGPTEPTNAAPSAPVY